MAENSHIQWTDHTFNPWIGCTKISPGCQHCYAETLMDTRYRRVKWGKGQPRQRTSEANWKLPLKWNEVERLAGELWKTVNDPAFPKEEFEGCTFRYNSKRPRVFCASLADWLDDEVPLDWFIDLLRLIDATQNLDWLLLTKRPENFWKRIEAVRNSYTSDVESAEWRMCNSWWFKHAVPNVWIGTTVENQEMADKRIPELLRIPARVRFLSCEPLLERVDLNLEHIEHSPDCDNEFCSLAGGPEDCDGVVTGNRIDWVICGGESGPGARKMEPAWVSDLLTQCEYGMTPFFFKQWGGVNKKLAGDLLNGRQYHEFPNVGEAK